MRQFTVRLTKSADEMLPRVKKSVGQTTDNKAIIALIERYLLDQDKIAKLEKQVGLLTKELSMIYKQLDAYTSAHSNLLGLQASKEVKEIIDQRKMSTMSYWDRINYERRQRNDEEE